LRVDVAGHKFVFPSVCACCCGAADSQLDVHATRYSGKRVVHTSTRCWSIPYCSSCLRHVAALERAAARGKLLVFLSLIGGLILLIVGAAVGGAIGAILGILATVLAVLWISSSTETAKRSASAMRTTSCAHVGRAVVYLGWHGTLHQFDFASLHFGQEFMLNNHKKLVNMTPAAMKFLATSEIQQPDAPRSARKYMS